MKPHIAQQIEALQDLTLAELREEYARVFGEPTTCRNKRHLVKRIIWGIQARAEGGISERARRRAAQLAKESDLRLLAPRGTTGQGPPMPARITPPRDRRLPMVGSVITKQYRGRTIAVTVRDDGFEHDGTLYKSLTAVARAVSGTRWNGYLFFNLVNKANRRS